MGQFRRFGLLDQLDVFGLGIDNAAKEVLSAVSACPARPPDRDIRGGRLVCSFSVFSNKMRGGKRAVSVSHNLFHPCRQQAAE